MNVRPSALIIMRDRILTLRYKYNDTEVFALPGGNPDAGECLNVALERELQEELGVTSDINEMVISGEVIWREIQKETLHIVFDTKINGSPTLNPTETTALEVVWLSIEDLDKKILYPNVGKQIQQFAKQMIPSGHIGVIDQPYIK